jgi:O-methyltransferase
MCKDMMTLEQAANLQHLLHSVLLRNVKGEFVEVGCYVGQTSSVITGVLDAQEQRRPFHVYDLFTHMLGGRMDVRKVFERNFADLGLPLPTIHEGDVLQTLPAQLPGSIAFAHIDLGVGGGTDRHSALIAHALRSIYPRLAQGAILVLMDYHVPGVTVNGGDVNPGVRIAVDAFFQDKPEKPVTLYGGAYSHGYVRKL